MCDKKERNESPFGEIIGVNIISGSIREERLEQIKKMFGDNVYGVYSKNTAPEDGVYNPIEENIISFLKENVEEDGGIITSTSASGREVDEIEIKRVFNMTFSIDCAEREAFDNLILEAHGEKGLAFCKQEFRDWMSDTYENPGLALYEDHERWRPILNTSGRFDYSYNQRIHAYGQLATVIDLLSRQPDTRQAYISIYDPSIDVERIGQGYQIPCILGYGFSIDMEEKVLNMSVDMRSADITNCLRNDIWLANAFRGYMLNMLQIQYPELEPGELVFNVKDLHAYPTIGE